MMIDGASYPVPCAPCPRLQLAGVRRTFLFHVRGHTLTFSAGTPGGAMTRQPGSWVLPSEFHLLLATCRLGYEFRMAVLDA